MEWVQPVSAERVSQHALSPRDEEFQSDWSDFCETSRGVDNMASFLELKRLTVVTPKGTLVFEW